MSDSGTAHEVNKFSSCADDLHTGRILPVVYSGDCPNNGVPVSIVSDRDSIFMVHFWKSFQKAMGTWLMMSTAFHP